jgi:hypothetical protein
VCYSKDREFSDGFIPQIKQIVGPHLLCVTSLEQDRREAGDLTILRARDMMIACRVRRPGYLNFLGQFTIRLARDSGAKTEYEKFIEGFGDWFLYGHATADKTAIWYWMLIDLHVWRAHLIRTASRNVIKSGVKPNGDGTSFRWFDTESFPSDPPLLIAKHMPEPEESELLLF